MADLRTCRVEIGYVRTLVVTGDFKSAPGAGRSLLKDQAYFFASEVLLLCPGVLCAFKITSKIE
jgi:hypothetical protein